jgi:hypothetical protein
MIKTSSLVLASALLLATASAFAHDTNTGMQGMSGMDMHNMMGMHEMSATVSAVDVKTGIVDVTTGGMNLKLHFPPASLANVKAGDAITVHLGFTKP